MLRSIPPPWWSSRSCGPVSMGHHMRTDRRSQMVQKKPQHSLDTFKLHWLWRRLFRHPLVWIYVCVTPHEFTLLVLCLVITLRPKPTLPCHCPAVDPFRRCSITRHPGDHGHEDENSFWWTRSQRKWGKDATVDIQRHRGGRKNVTCIHMLLFEYIHFSFLH